jgi:ATP-binding cassette subfamily B protein
MAAEIVNELFGSRNVEKLIPLVLITVGGNFLIEILKSTLNRAFNHSSNLLNQREALHFHKKALSLDYDDLENSEIRQLRRKITDSDRAFGRGKSFLLWDIDSLISDIINICFAAYLFGEMLFMILREGINAPVLMFILGITALIAANIAYIFFYEKKDAELSRTATENMIDTNRIEGAIDSYNMGKDVRIYRQDKTIMWIKEVYIESLNKHLGSKYHNKQFALGILKSLLEHLLQILTYIFVCFYAIRGLFEIGSIIKYVSFIQRLINAVMSISGKISSMKYNTPFIEDYMNFFAIPQKMRKGTLTTEKRADNEYEIEFKNVSFKYPGSETYALKNLCLKFAIGRRMAVVGQNGSGKTTMIKLLCRLYDPTEGIITLNEIGRASCRERV